MDKNSKIIGFYSYTDYVGKDNEPKKVYVYVSKDKETGKLSYNITNEDSDEYKEAFVKYCKDNGYNKKNQDRIFTDNKFKANINCKSPEHVFSLIKKANKNVEVDEEEYNDIVDSYYKETTKRNIINKIKGFKELPKKGLYFIKSHPKVTVAAACLALIVGGGIFKLATNKGPTANNSRIATTVDNNKDNIDKNNTDNKTNEENKEEAKEETQKDTSSQATTTETTTNETYTATPTTYRNSGNSSSSNSSSSNNNSQSTGGSTSNSSNGNTGSGSTSGGTNGSSNSGSSVTDSNLPEFQDPNASIDDSNDQNTGNENTDEDDKYDNVIEEDPGNSNTNTDDSNNSGSDNNNSNDNTEDNTSDNTNDNNNSNNDTSNITEDEEPVKDEDYSQEIDVPAVSDDNENSNDTNNDTNNGDTSTETKEEDEDLTTGNIDLDPSIPESAIDSDLSYEYEESYDNESGNIDEIINAEPLPDPNETATGDYVTDENEWYFANDNSNTTTQNSDTATEDVDVVPVEQATTTTTTSNYDSNVAAVDQVIEAMANGNANVNLVYNQDGSLTVGYTETTPTAQAEAEASSMTK